jgi:uncharacterized membrane protein YeaQ/YmgE (transglycosylase-associated protein family)
MGHGLIWWIVVGLVAGVLAKALTPGTDREPKGCIMTIILGIAGSVLVGLVLDLIGGGNAPGGMLGTIVGATIGAVVLILAFRKFWK